jgi:hypothetical protein
VLALRLRLLQFLMFRGDEGCYFQAFVLFRSRWAFTHEQVRNFLARMSRLPCTSYLVSNLEHVAFALDFRM